jgi:ABC-2 type transport system permease protein
MRTLSVARNDFLNVRRSKLLWFVCALYALFSGLFFYVGSTGDLLDVNRQLFNMSGIAVLIIPLVAVVAAYLAIAGERESGSIRIRLGLPTTRLELVLGKFLSRATMVFIAVLLALLVAAGLSVALYPDPDLSAFPTFGVLISLFALAYVSIALGISAATATRARAMGYSIGYFFVFNVLWLAGQFSVAAALRFVFKDTLGLKLGQNFYDFIISLSPASAYLNSLYLVFDPSNFGPQLPPLGDVPWYLSPEFSAVVLVGWFVLPLVVGYLVFRRAELS